LFQTCILPAFEIVHNQQNQLGGGIAVLGYMVFAYFEIEFQKNFLLIYLYQFKAHISCLS
jgi:hypothetical protein